MLRPKIKYYFKKEKAFTLIELLVVIAIIGLLAAVTLVAVKNATKRARIAGGLQFEAQVHHAVGAYAVGIWDFDNDSGSVATDISGNNNNGTTYGAVWKCTSDDKNNTPSGSGCSLEFDGVDDYIEILDSPSLNPTEAITITVWVYAYSSSPKTILNKSSYTAAPTKGYTIYIIGDPAPDRWICFDIGTEGGRIRFRTTGLENVLLLNRWVFLAFTYYSSVPPDAKIYIDGQSTKSFRDPSWTQEWPGGGDIVPSTEDLYIRRTGTSGKVLIDNVSIYEQALISAQIKKLYVEEAIKRDLLVKE